MVYVVGLMSGTSLDGIDAALVEIRGVDQDTNFELKAFKTLPFKQEVKEKIKKTLDDRTAKLSEICSLNFELSYLFAEAVRSVCKEFGIKSSDLEFIASHGQTIYHQPLEESGKGIIASTLQIGNPGIICELTGSHVISDFRSRDIAVGGQGAPIVPYTEKLIYQELDTTVFLQNIGGIGNVTVLPMKTSASPILAFDTGPGNMLIDEACRYFYNSDYDPDGRYARKGQINLNVLEDILNEDYFKRPTPKTTGRELFGKAYFEQLMSKFSLSANDWISTLTAVTAYSISRSIKPLLAKGRNKLIVGGGGSNNSYLFELIKNDLPNVEVLRQEDMGYNSDAKEAIAMALLGNQTWNKRIGNVPSATGATKEVILGSITYYD